MTASTLFRLGAIALAVLLLGAGVASAQGPGATLPAPAGNVTAGDLRWHTDPTQARAEARANGRPLYVYIWAKYDPECINMADECLAHEAVVAQLAGFELLALDAHSRVNFAFFDEYQIPYVRLPGLHEETPMTPLVGEGQPVPVTGAARWPTSLFLDSEGAEVYRMYGYVPGKAFAVVLSQVTEVLKWRAALHKDPNSAVAEAQLGHLYTVLQVFPEARKHLRRALDLDPQNITGVHPDVQLDLIIMDVPDNPAAGAQKLREWRQIWPAHPRRLEAVYYEAVSEVALERLDAAVKILLPFKQAVPGSAEANSQWYLPALTLLAKIEAARRAPGPAPPRG